MKAKFFTLTSLLLFAKAICQPLPEFTPSFRISDTPTHRISSEQEYTFGYMEVLENRGDPNSGTIEFPVYIFKSRNPNPQPDPIIYTVGGPGSSTMPSAPYMASYKYLDDRDFILVEQRGNYYARPHLGCPEWAEAIYLSNVPGHSDVATDSLLAAAARNCRERLSKSGIDLSGYQTREIAADISELVKALGIREYNLLTISYSTRIAQVLLRDYPEGIRSVVMDSPLPLEVHYDEESTANLMEATEALLASCASDPSCEKAYPSLQDRFFAFLRETSEKPLEVVVENPNTGNSEKFYLQGKDLIAVFASASTGDVPYVPREINKLLEGDLSTVRDELAALFKGPGEGAGIGMRLSVWCAEEFPFTSRKRIAQETNRYPEIRGLSPAVFNASVCGIWGVQQVSAEEKEAVASPVPVLFINGEFDHETPVKWAAQMLPNYPNAFHLVFPGWKHTPTTNWANPCAMEAASAFFNGPFKKPEPDCYGENTAVKFYTE